MMRLVQRYPAITIGGLDVGPVTLVFARDRKPVNLDWEAPPSLNRPLRSTLGQSAI